MKTHSDGKLLSTTTTFSCKTGVKMMAYENALKIAKASLIYEEPIDFRDISKDHAEHIEQENNAYLGLHLPRNEK